jgi:hypothetical protein
MSRSSNPVEKPPISGNQYPFNHEMPHSRSTPYLPASFERDPTSHTSREKRISAEFESVRSVPEYYEHRNRDASSQQRHQCVKTHAFYLEPVAQFNPGDT